VKKFVISLLVGFMVSSVFGQETERPVVFYEFGIGYNIGINMDGSVPVDIKMTIPFSDFGFTLAGGAHIAENTGGHIFAGLSYFIINNEQIRLPVSLGFEMHGNNRSTYLGITGMVSYHYVLTKDFYIGFNAEINYYFNNRYSDLGNGKGSSVNSVDYSKVPPVPVTTFPSPETEIRDHWGSFVTIKPTICIGIQL
jgi:hypothetical protein